MAASEPRWSLSERMPSSTDPSPRVAAFMAHWQSLRPAPGVLPGRQHFDPMRVPRFLPNVWLIDVVPGPPRRYRLRLVGGAIVDAGFVGQPGDFMDDPRVSADPVAVVATLDKVVDTGQPDWRRGPTVVKHDKYVERLERVLMPLARDGTHVDMIIGLTIFHRGQGRMD